MRHACAPYHSCVELHFRTDWLSNKTPEWAYYLQCFVGRPHLHFLEIGSWEGRSACWFLTHVLTHPSSRITCIDPFPSFGEEEIRRYGALWGLAPPLPKIFSTEEKFDANIRALGAQGKTEKLKASSHVALRSLPLASFDCIYIDGSHKSTDVLEDAVLSWRLLREGGLLLFDDYHLAQNADPLWNPGRGIDAFLSVFGEECDVLHKDAHVILRKGKTGARNARTCAAPESVSL